MNELEIGSRIDGVEGGMRAVESLVLALCEVLPVAMVPVVRAFFASEIEAARVQLQEGAASSATIEALENDAHRLTARLEKLGG